MTSEQDELVRAAAAAARAALLGWSPYDADSADRLAIAIGEAVVTALARHEEILARITAGRMAGLSAEEEMNDWSV